jgi:hypothetical protein
MIYVSVRAFLTAKARLDNYIEQIEWRSVE